MIETVIARLGSPTIGVQLVRRFPSYDVRRLQFQFEDHFRAYVNAESVPNPAAANSGLPPDAPRFAMIAGPRSVVVSNNASILGMNFDAGFDRRKLIGAIEKAADFHDGADKFFIDQPRFYKGLVLSAQYMVNEIEIAELIKDIAESIFSDKPTCLNAITANMMADANNIRHLVEVSNINNYSTEIISLNAPQFVHFDMDFMNPTSKGFQIKIDVSTKPSIEDGGHKSFRDLTGSLSNADSIVGFLSIRPIVERLFQ
jgi:hypothetical protein